MISDRKYEHLLICKNSDVEYEKSTGFEDIELVHRCLPEVDLDEIDTTIDFFGKTLDTPLVISAITGGHPICKSINQDLATVAQKNHIAMGIGSQRAGISNPELIDTYKIVREYAPTAAIIGNIGASQVKLAQDAIDMIDADSLAIHLNPLQEVIQPEGDIKAKGITDNIESICKEVSKPVIVKETGAGISGCDAKILEDIGVDMIDIEGSGGTSWAAVEMFRAKDPSLGKTFSNWGIPTAVSTIETLENVSIPVISSGGIRNGLDAAKAIALGSHCVGMALPFLKDVYEGSEAIDRRIKQFTNELKIAMFLVGASSIKQLQQKKLIITGKTKETLNQLNIDTKKFTRRI